MKLYINFSDFKPWSDAVKTWEKIEDAGKIDALEFYLEDIYPDGMSSTQLNDLLWMEPETVYEWLGMEEEEEFTEEFDTFCSHFSICTHCPLDNYCHAISECDRCFKNNKDNLLESIKGQERDVYNKEIISF